MVTFGSSGLDRAGDARKDAEALWADPTARTLVLWRGKPLVSRDKDKALRLPTYHPIMADAAPDRVLIGREDGAALFAVELRDWVPAEGLPETMNAFLDTSEQSHPTVDGVFAELRSVMTHLSPRDAEVTATARANFEWHRTHRYCSTCGHLSDFANAGWQRNCPSCGRSHFPRTDPVVIMLITKDDRVLVGRSPGWPEGMYSLLAGFIEPGETMEAAVRREVMEEAGVVVGPVSYLASQPWPFPASLMFGCWGEALSDDITLDPAELEHALWLSRADLQTVFDGQHPQIKPARKGAIAHFLLDNWLRNTLD